MSLRHGILLAAAVAVLAVGSQARAQSITLPLSGENQRTTLTQSIGLVSLTVDYSSPNVTGPNGQSRRGHIWGELVPFGMHDLGFNDCKECPWRAGANFNTIFKTSHDILVEGQSLKAGAYGLFMLADPNEWTVIFSSNCTSWGSFTYNPAEDVLRVKVKPGKCEYHEFLDYEFTDRMPDHATLALQWEELQVPIRITVPNMNDLYVAQIQRELRDYDWFNWLNWEGAAQFCLANNTHLKQGLEWAEASVNKPFVGVKSFRTLTTLAQLQISNGLRPAATKTVDEAMTMPATVLNIHQFARQLQLQKEDAIAIRVFEANAKRFPNQWPVQLGLARGYAGRGDFKKALQAAQLAVKQAPDEPSRMNVETLIKQWTESAAKAN
ncbi:MAG: DUF2911 domain-containing protein [Candidatus Eisenbacteria bacterium]|uniref:DUF2911 domain-containing protein n=1 Tax=Eiseniibacteriota bacterium TaxID=2212470 RepID=A0A849SIG1_UNCEI|nr:DUF2911 domain-containing protein [Candidatus Eisenbacteria bacterium]